MTALARLTPLFAVLTLPVGILAGLFMGLDAALAVFVVGWLLLVPASAILFGMQQPWGIIYGEHETSPETVTDWLDVAERIEARSNDESARERESAAKNPIEQLRDRYARGEIDEAELERRLEALLETEDLDPNDEEAIQGAIDRLDTTRSDGSETMVDPERE